MTFKLIKNSFPFLLTFLIVVSCQRAKQISGAASNAEECCVSTIPDRFDSATKSANLVSSVNIDSLIKTNPALEKMLFIPGGIFNMGARDAQFAREDEYPVHPVKVNSFFMDPHPVTNAQLLKKILTGMNSKNSFLRARPNRQTACWTHRRWCLLHLRIALT